MRTKLYMIALAAMTMILALSACSESEDLLSAFHSDPNAVRITAQVGKASANGFTRSFPLGDAEAQKNFKDGDMISVKADGQDAVTYQLNGDEWQPQGNKFLKWESDKMNFTAYYPATFNGTITQPTEYNKEADLAAADFMSFTGNVKNPGDNSLTLEMNRLMARVVVEIAGFNDQYTNATVNSLSICGVKAYKQETDGKFYALIDPNYTTSTAPFLSLEVADGESKTTETLTTIPTTFEAGKSYTYKLTVGKNKISVSGINVANWNTGTITDNGKAEQIIPYVTFKAEGAQTFKMTTKNGYEISGLEYSVNNGDWATVKAGTEVPFGGTNGNLRLRGTNTNGTAKGPFDYSTITFTEQTVNVACTGDIRTLLDWRNYNTVGTRNAKFCSLFLNCSVLTSAPELPATKLAKNCYIKMFYGCTSLESAPKLTATKLADWCYYGMFEGCTSLKIAPELPATTLADYCYKKMFNGCKSLETAPTLSVKDLASECYNGMFKDCTSLKTAPILPAESLTSYCYSEMFYGCTSLESAPELCATELAEECYSFMFKGCEKLSSVTMSASSDQIKKNSNCCLYWLNDAGTSAKSRTLIVLDETAYNELESNTKYLPAIWKKDQCTVENYTPKQ